MASSAVERDNISFQSVHHVPTQMDSCVSGMTGGPSKWMTGQQHHTHRGYIQNLANSSSHHYHQHPQYRYLVHLYATKRPIYRNHAFKQISKPAKNTASTPITEVGRRSNLGSHLSSVYLL